MPASRTRGATYPACRTQSDHRELAHELSTLDLPAVVVPSRRDSRGLGGRLTRGPHNKSTGVRMFE
jgi:hypothetical protein